jgi:hypothetical protein
MRVGSTVDPVRGVFLYSGYFALRGVLGYLCRTIRDHSTGINRSSSLYHEGTFPILVSKTNEVYLSSYTR